MDRARDRLDRTEGSKVRSILRSRGTNYPQQTFSAHRNATLEGSLIMARLAAAAAILALCYGVSFAQTNSPTSSTPPANQPLVAGANSFTAAQAQDRIEKAGFSEVKGLKKDDQGIWRGTAMQSGKQVNVALDFRGNVVANP
jgi:hypothetical protein